MRVALVGLLVLGGCATLNEAERQTTTWADAETPTEVDAAPASHADIAATAPGYLSAHECTASAQSLYAKSPENGWALMQGCMRRHDFIDLTVMRSDPWRSLLKERVDLYSNILDVIVRQGADPVEQEAQMKAIGLPISLWTADQGVSRTTLLYALRGEIKDIRWEKGGRFGIVLETARETSMDGGRYVYNPTSRTVTRSSSARVVKTGKKIIAKIEGLAIEPGHEYLFLARGADRNVGKAMFENEMADAVLELVAASRVR
jgi:hypothetical protein